MALAHIQPTFWSEGACVGLDPELFHPERGESTSDAKTVCATCTVRVECLDWALTNHEKFGIWGGTSERERRRIKRRIVAGQAVPELTVEWLPAAWPSRSRGHEGSGGGPVNSEPGSGARYPIPSPDLHRGDTVTSGEVVSLELADAAHGSALPGQEQRSKRARGTGAPTAHMHGAWAERGLSARPNDEEVLVDLAIAQPQATTTNGGRPVDPATGKPTDVCVNCGTRYTPVRRDQRFHSKECARAWYSSHPKTASGKREPRVGKRRAYKPRAAKAAATKSPPEVTPAATAGTVEGPTLPASTVTSGGAHPETPVDLQSLLGQLLAGCDRWHIEADLGDVHVSISRGSP